MFHCRYIEMDYLVHEMSPWWPPRTHEGMVRVSRDVLGHVFQSRAYNLVLMFFLCFFKVFLKHLLSLQSIMLIKRQFSKTSLLNQQWTKFLVTTAQLQTKFGGARKAFFGLLQILFVAALL